MTKLTDHRIARLSPRQRRLLELRFRERGGQASVLPIPRRRPEHDALPLSFGQERLWFLACLAPDSAAYNISVSQRLQGAFDSGHFECALRELVRRHEVLRTVFREVDGRTVQLVQADSGVSVPRVDLQRLTSPDRKAEGERLSNAQARAPFDLTRGPLVRVLFLQWTIDAHWMQVTIHHIVADGWSMGILSRELVALYEASLAGRPSPLPELPIQYGDFAVWQRSWLQGEVLDREIAHWRRQLEGAPQKLSLATDRPRMAIQVGRGSHCSVPLSATLTGGLSNLTREARATPFVLMLAAFKALLQRYTGQDDVVVGSPIANRNREETEGLIGFFVNTLVLRSDLAGDPSFRQLLERVQKVFLDAEAHQDLPFEKLVEALAPERSLDRHAPLFQVMFASQQGVEASSEQVAAQDGSLEGATAAIQFDLILRIEEGGRLACWLEYDVDLFDRTTIQRMRSHYLAILESGIANPDAQLSELRLLSSTQRHQLSAEWNDSRRAFASPPASCYQLFAAQVARSPEAIAVVCQGLHLTYGQLDARAGKLASRLRRLGVGPDDVVAICLERSAEMIVAWLAAWKAGGAYLPLDPANPSARRLAMVRDAGARVLVTVEALAGGFSEEEVPHIWLDRQARSVQRVAQPASPIANPVQVRDQNLAYVMYTSGSTGRPKGVMISHRGLVNYLSWCTGAYDLEAGWGAPVHTSSGFDLTVTSLLAPLVAGRQVLLLPGERGIESLDTVLSRAPGSSLVKLTPTHLGVLSQSVAAARVGGCARVLVLGGEALTRGESLAFWLRHAPATRLFNEYGPTETVVGCCVHEVTAQGAPSQAVAIGRPIANTWLRVFGADWRRVPIGVPGELAIGGAGLARGYGNRPAATAEKFVPDPFADAAGCRLYRTGDLVRALANGELAFLGRIDRQAKVHGFRIELEEIEGALNQHPKIRRSVVRLGQDPRGHDVLAAYYVSRQEQTVSVLRAFLADYLPLEIIPDAFIHLRRLPLTLNGKVDDRALPDFAETQQDLERRFLAPANQIEETLAGIWIHNLEVEHVGRFDNFFAIGGQSLLATRVLSQIRDVFGVELPLRRIFEAPTVEGLAARIEAELRSGQGRDLPPIEPVPRRDGLPRHAVPLSFAQERLWFLELLEPGSPIYNIWSIFELDGHLDPVALERALSEIVRRHEVLRTLFRETTAGPMQHVQSPRTWRLPLVDLSALGAAQRRREARRLAAAEARRPFDLARGPLLRTHLLRLSAGSHVGFLTLHHIVGDGWSMEIFLAEMSTLYEAYQAGRPSLLAELPIGYADFAHWQRGWLAGADLETRLAYWRKQLAGAPPVLALPFDRPRPAVQTYRGASRTFALSQGLSGGLRILARDGGATLYMVLLAAFQALLGRVTGERDLVIGMPIAGRGRSEIQGLIGFFVNTLVLRCSLAEDPSFRQLLDQAREVVLEAHTHQDLPFEKLVEELVPTRSLSHSPLFQVMFLLQNASRSGKKFGGLKSNLLAIDTGTAKFDLTLGMTEAERLTGLLEYNTDLFDRATIWRLERQLIRLLEGLGSHPDRAISGLPLLADAEQHLLLAEWNDSVTDAPRDHCLHELFETQARRTPETVAVVCGDRQLSYRELDRRADRLAHTLMSRGVGPEARVGVCVERSLEMAIGLLGILKAGGAYVPLDASYPRPRLRHILQDAGVRLLLVQKHLISRLPEPAEERLTLDEGTGRPTSNLLREPTVDSVCTAVPENLLALLYTSGSTGMPKGVMVHHRGIVNRLLWAWRTYRLRATDTVLQKASFNFDFSLWEIFGPLIAGARVVMARPDGEKDGPYLVSTVREQRLTILHFVPSMLDIFLTQAELERCTSLRFLFSGGEALSPVLVERCAERLPRVVLRNQYGPTEISIDTTDHICQHGQESLAVPIGNPIANARLYLLDPRLRPVVLGSPGELGLAGDGVTRGYRGRPGQTAKRFVPDPFGPEPGERLYLTGDLTRRLAGGELIFMGRIDQQIKVRGFRIEPGEIEAVLGGHPAVRESVVVARSTPSGDGAVAQSPVADQRLVAYVVVDQDQPVDDRELRAHLRRQLPDYMVPAAFVPLPALPLAPGGKLDRGALPLPDGPRPATSAPRLAPASETEEAIAAIWRQVLQVADVGAEDNFFDLGGHSLLLARVHSQLRQQLEREISMVELFRYPTIRSLAAHLSGEKAAEPSATVLATPRDSADSEIAIVGMAGRFPGASDIGGFWRNLRAGVESITFFSDEELQAAGIGDALLRDPAYVKAAGVLSGAEEFDAPFFGFTPREAEVTDPQHRVFLECAWEALETAGYDPERYGGAIGVFGGVSFNSYWENLLSHPELLESVGSYQAILANDKDFLATRVSYKLNLKGPSVNVQTACSTSLVAVHLACRNLLEGECDLALAGGVSIQAQQQSGHLYTEGGILSPDGHCRAFDARAGGTLGGSGVGIVVLKRLADALRDGDTIDAVIKGSAVNNDGAIKVGFTAPSVDGQAEVIRKALARARVPQESIGYIETHGTGTELGDPIEVAALVDAFGPGVSERGVCAIGSVKTNVGHLDAAAGVTGLIKTVLTLRHGEIPASLHFEQPNPAIDFAHSPFYVNDRLREWSTEATPRRAAVSSFGIGGTNAHMVLEQAPVAGDRAAARPWQLLLLSARTDTALAAATERLKAHLEHRPELHLPDVAYTLQVGRKMFEHRRVLVCQDLKDAVAAAENQPPDRVFSQRQKRRQRPVGFMFPGQGAQYPGMGRELYSSEPVFRDQIDRCVDILAPLLGNDLRRLLYPRDGELSTEAASRQLAQTAIAQPALFVVEYALARLWMDWGVRPHAMIGHSIGEYVAACLAEVLSLEEALALVAIRGRLMQELAPGAMLAVSLSEEAIAARIGAHLALAAVNGPTRCVVSGSTEAIAALKDELSREDVGCRLLVTSHAFHSQMMEPMLEPFAAAVRNVRLRPPTIPYLSNVTGGWITPEQATDPSYWVEHLRSTVRFSPGLRTLLQDSDRMLLEVGPGEGLSTLARQHVKPSDGPVALPSLPRPQDRFPADAFLLRTLGRLWLAGVEPDWDRLHSDPPRRVTLPTYPFERQRFWLDRRPNLHERSRTSQRLGKKSDPADWFYLPFWKPSVPLPESAADAIAAADSPPEGSWLVFNDGRGLGEKLAARLERAGHQVTVVEVGTGLTKISERRYAIDPQAHTDYHGLLRELLDTGHDTQVPLRIIHAWGVSDPREERSEHGTASQLGLYSLVSLTQALVKQHLTADLRMTVLTDQVQPVTGEEELCPEKATVLGPCKVTSQEYPDITCRSVDLVVPEPDSWQEEQLLSQLMAELTVWPNERFVAYRADRRWVQDFEAVRLNSRPGAGRVLREGGVYLITGGLGGIGLTLAEHLARTARARLILTGRTVWPARAAWQDWLSTHDEHNEISGKIRKVLELEAAGAEVMVVSADVASEEQMRELLVRAQKRFGTLHGVLHAAGLTGGAAFSTLEEIDREACEQHFRSKGLGLRVLEQMLAETDLDFCVLFSSLSTVLGGLGLTAYAAANHFMDAFARQHNRSHPVPWTSVSWDGWKLWVGEEAGHGFGAAGADLALEPAEGAEALERLLDARIRNQVVVSTGDLHARIDQWLRPLAPEEQEVVTQHARPELETTYEEPRNATEESIAELWQELLGIETVGIHDSFFELGGDSLLATQLSSRLRRLFQVELSLRTVLEAPSVAGLSEAVEKSRSEHEDALALEGLLAEVADLSPDELEAELARELSAEEERR